MGSRPGTFRDSAVSLQSGVFEPITSFDASVRVVSRQERPLRCRTRIYLPNLNELDNGYQKRSNLYIAGDWLEDVR
jgi:hypothetical protein